MSLYLHGIGTAVPPHAIAQSDAASAAQSFSLPSRAEQLLAARMFDRCGVGRRHSVILESSTPGSPMPQSFYQPAEQPGDFGPTTGERMKFYEARAGELGTASAREALAAAETAPAEITHLITISCTGFHSPGVDVALVRDLGLNPGVSRTHIGFMGCHAALNGLRVAKAFTDSDPRSCVLICAVELCSLHYQYRWTTDAIVANALFADGAAAVVGRGGPAEGRRWQLQAAASALVPDTEDAMSWRIGDNGFEMTLSARVPELIRERLRDWLTDWLAGLGLSIGQIASWAIHPGGPRILAACGNACGLPDTALQVSAEVLSQFGNMSSPTILFIIDRLQRQSAGAPCVALAFGPGLTIEAALLV
jgi:predicted naringenin-chalcone synthase